MRDWECFWPPIVFPPPILEQVVLSFLYLELLLDPSRKLNFFFMVADLSVKVPKFRLHVFLFSPSWDRKLIYFSANASAEIEMKPVIGWAREVCLKTIIFASCWVDVFHFLWFEEQSIILVWLMWWIQHQALVWKVVGSDGSKFFICPLKKSNIWQLVEILNSGSQ